MRSCLCLAFRAGLNVSKNAPPAQHPAQHNGKLGTCALLLLLSFPRHTVLILRSFSDVQSNDRTRKRQQAAATTLRDAKRIERWRAAAALFRKPAEQELQP